MYFGDAGPHYDHLLFIEASEFSLSSKASIYASKSTAWSRPPIVWGVIDFFISRNCAVTGLINIGREIRDYIAEADNITL